MNKWRKVVGAVTTCALLGAGVVATAAQPAVAVAPPAPDITAFSYTGSAETYTVPAGVNRLFVVAAGAMGGKGSLGTGGFGAVASGVLDVSSVEELSIRVGQQPTTAAGGFNGGGNGGAGTTTPGLGGGGATDVRVGGDGLDDRVIVAAGGGGASVTYGGDGGTPTGGAGFSSGTSTGGGGATQSTGGTAGTSVAASTEASGGSSGQGGDGASNASTVSGGGGGGGYFGGGGGGLVSSLAQSSSGGGGSSYLAESLVSSANQQVSYNWGNGYLWIVPLADNSFVANEPATSQFTATDSGAHEVLLLGGSGGGNKYLSTPAEPVPGKGAAVRFTSELTANSVYDVNVGGAGAPYNGGSAGAGGYNGGGTGGNGHADASGGSGGGGATDVRPTGGDAASRLGVAGGGGGTPNNGTGGAGGNPAADGNASADAGGKAGTVSTPGAGGVGTIHGSPATGATGGAGGNLTGRNRRGGGGGGGGYNGGGGGAGSATGGGGGGGFSYAPSPATNVSYPSQVSTSGGFAIITPPEQTVPGPLSFADTDFGSTTFGTSKDVTVTVTNDGTAAVTPSAITPAGSGVALNTLSPGTCATATPIATGADCTVVLTWTPATAGALTGASLTIAYPGGASAEDSAPLTGTADQVSPSGGQTQTLQRPCLAVTERMPKSGIKRLVAPGCKTTAGQQVGTRMTFKRTRGDIRSPRLRCLSGRVFSRVSTLPAKYGPGAKYCKRGTLVLDAAKQRVRVRVVWTAPKTAAYKSFKKVLVIRT